MVILALFHYCFCNLIRVGPLFVNQDDENELLGDIFSVGQLVPCIVLELDDDKKEAGKRKIWLSLRLSLLHKGFSFDSFQLGMVCQSLVHFPLIL